MPRSPTDPGLTKSESRKSFQKQFDEFKIEIENKLRNSYHENQTLQHMVKELEHKAQQLKESNEKFKEVKSLQSENIGYNKMTEDLQTKFSS